MSSATPTTNDPVALVDSLEPKALRSRIEELDRQTRALRVLLRAAIARERADLRRQARAEEVSSAR